MVALLNDFNHISAVAVEFTIIDHGSWCVFQATLMRTEYLDDA